MKTNAIFCSVAFGLICGISGATSLAANAQSPLKLSTETEQKIAAAKVRRALENGERKQVTDAPPVVQLDEIRVLGTIEPRVPEKSPIQKLRDTLDKGDAERKDHVTETPANDGARYAQVNIGGKIYCIEERRGLIDIAGHVDASGLVPRPILMSPMGKRCRTGQY